VPKSVSIGAGVEGLEANKRSLVWCLGGSVKVQISECLIVAFGGGKGKGGAKHLLTGSKTAVQREVCFYLKTLDRRGRVFLADISVGGKEKRGAGGKMTETFIKKAYLRSCWGLRTKKTGGLADFKEASQKRFQGHAIQLKEQTKPLGKKTRGGG